MEKKFFIIIEAWQQADRRITQVENHLFDDMDNSLQCEELRVLNNDKMHAAVIQLFKITEEEAGSRLFNDIFYSAEDYFWVDWEADTATYNYVCGLIAAYNSIK